MRVTVVAVLDEYSMLNLFILCLFLWISVLVCCDGMHMIICFCYLILLVDLYLEFDHNLNYSNMRGIMIVVIVGWIGLWEVEGRLTRVETFGDHNFAYKISVWIGEGKT